MKLKSSLPKQWKHWAKKFGLRTYYGHGKEGNYDLKGRNRRWRVNCFGDFQCSCPNEYFDRWANSLAATFDGFPKTEKEFMFAVKTLIEQSKDKR